MPDYEVEAEPIPGVKPEVYRLSDREVKPAHRRAEVRWGKPEVTKEALVVPMPEIPPHFVGVAELPRGAKTVYNRGAKAGWSMTAVHSRGPRLGESGKLLESQADSWSVTGQLERPPGRGWLALWVANNGKPKLEFAYTITPTASGRVATAVDSDGLKNFIAG